MRSGITRNFACNIACAIYSLYYIQFSVWVDEQRAPNTDRASFCADSSRKCADVSLIQSKFALPYVEVAEFENSCFKLNQR